jgi:hypothetical protein
VATTLYDVLGSYCGGAGGVDSRICWNVRPLIPSMLLTCWIEPAARNFSVSKKSSALRLMQPMEASPSVKTSLIVNFSASFVRRISSHLNRYSSQSSKSLIAAPIFANTLRASANA